MIVGTAVTTVTLETTVPTRIVGTKVPIPVVSATFVGTVVSTRLARTSIPILFYVKKKKYSEVYVSKTLVHNKYCWNILDMLIERPPQRSHP